MRTTHLTSHTFVRPLAVVLVAAAAAVAPSTAVALPQGGGAAAADVVTTSADSTPFEQVYLRGTFNYWGLTAMHRVPGTTNTWTADVYGVSGEDRFKFDVHGDWDENYGQSDQYRVAGRNGADIPFPAARGAYTVVFDGTTKEYGIRPLGFASHHPSMNVRGTFNNWGITGMTLAEDHLWTTAVWLSPGDRLKFDVDGTWATNYGDDGADGTLERNGADIVVHSPGVFRVTFDELTSTYRLTRIR
jgi:1,4-alpha-glucan branching enzyme